MLGERDVTSGLRIMIEVTREEVKCSKTNKSKKKIKIQIVPLKSFQIEISFKSF